MYRISEMIFERTAIVSHWLTTSVKYFLAAMSLSHLAHFNRNSLYCDVALVFPLVFSDKKHAGAGLLRHQMQ